MLLCENKELHGGMSIEVVFVFSRKKEKEEEELKGSRAEWKIKPWGCTAIKGKDLGARLPGSNSTFFICSVTMGSYWPSL